MEDEPDRDELMRDLDLDEMDELEVNPWYISSGEKNNNRVFL